VGRTVWGGFLVGFLGDRVVGKTVSLVVIADLQRLGPEPIEVSTYGLVGVSRRIHGRSSLGSNTSVGMMVSL
jgi:hypothetical protein